MDWRNFREEPLKLSYMAQLFVIDAELLNKNVSHNI